MPQPLGDRISVPTQEWDLYLTIGNMDYSAELMSVQIISNISSPYQVFLLVLMLDPIDTIFEKLYGSKNVKLSIRKKSYEALGAFTDEINFDLIQLNDRSALTQKSMINREKNYMPSVFKMVMVPREPLKAMTTITNSVFIGATPKEAVESVVNNTKVKLVYDNTDVNIEKIPQVVIPPMTVYKAIKYIDDNFGLYKGISNQGFCMYNNTLYVENLSKKVTNSQLITIQHLTAGSEESNRVLNEEMFSDTVFWCRHHLMTKYNGNTSVANVSKKATYNIKPMNMLYKNVTIDFIELCKEYGVIGKSDAAVKDPTIFYDNILDDIFTYRTHQIGGYGGDSDVFLKSRLARQLFSMTEVTLTLDRNPRILNLMRVGATVKLNTQTAEYVDVSGKFILRTSNISFMRDNVDWQSGATLTLSRTNKLMI